DPPGRRVGLGENYEVRIQIAMRRDPFFPRPRLLITSPGRHRPARFRRRLTAVRPRETFRVAVSGRHTARDGRFGHPCQLEYAFSDRSRSHLITRLRTGHAP